MGHSDREEIAPLQASAQCHTWCITAAAESRQDEEERLGQTWKRYRAGVGAEGVEEGRRSSTYKEYFQLPAVLVLNTQHVRVRTLEVVCSPRVKHRDTAISIIVYCMDDIAESRQHCAPLCCALIAHSTPSHHRRSAGLSHLADHQTTDRTPSARHQPRRHNS